MQTRSFRGSGEPAWVIASSNACEGLGPDPRRALGPAAIRAALTGRTHDRTRPMLHQRKKALVNQAPSTHDPQRTCSALFNNLVSALLEKRRYIDAKCVRCLEIDNQFEFCGLLYGHVCRFTAPQNFVHKKSTATKQGGAVRAI